MDKDFDKVVDAFMDDLQQMITKLGDIRKQYHEMADCLSLKKGQDVADWKYRNVYPFTMKLNEYGFSVRTYNCLHAMNIDTIGDLVAWRKRDMRRCRNLGRKSLDEIEDCMYKLGLTWHMWDNGQNTWDTYDK